MSNGITADNLLLTFPDMLWSDESLAALATIIASAAETFDGQISRALIYPKIEELSADLLDILAVDFKVDWWDPNLSLLEKRDLFKNSWHVHRHMGTKGAVEAAISAIYEDTQVQEWFEYDGHPYHFKLLINAQYQSVDPATHQRVLDRIGYYKNQRSVLDAVEYTGGYADALAYAGIGMAGIQITQSATAYNY